MIESVFSTPWSGKGNQSIGTLAGWAGWPVPQPVQPFSPENLFFYVLFFFNT